MSFDLHSASERTNQTIHAAEVIHDNAPSIAACCSDAMASEVVVVAVSHDHAFRGVWIVPRSRLADTVRELDDGGWTLTFSPGTTVEEVEERAHAMAKLAFKRWETTRRWASKHR
jgi:hypothetical protein